MDNSADPRRHGRPNRQLAVNRLRLSLFRVDLYRHVAGWSDAIKPPVWLYDAWRLLEPDVLARIVEQACHDYAGSDYTLPQKDDGSGNYIICYHYADLYRRGHAAAHQALYSGKLIAEGIAPGSPIGKGRERIAPERWGAVSINWDSCEMGPAGTENTNIIIYRSESVSTEGRRPPPANELRVDEWVKEWIAELQSIGKQGSEESVWRAAQEHFKGAERRNTVLASYRKLAPTEWKKQGRRRRKPAE
jgi:hypothetical protein